MYSRQATAAGYGRFLGMLLDLSSSIQMKSFLKHTFRPVVRLLGKTSWVDNLPNNMPSPMLPFPGLL